MVKSFLNQGVCERCAEELFELRVVRRNGRPAGEKVYGLNVASERAYRLMHDLVMQCMDVKEKRGLTNQEK